MRSSAFSVKVNGQPVDVAHAAASYDYVSFDANGPTTVEITAADPSFWDKGVDIQPWRLGLRPVREGQSIRFKLTGTAKLSISRPGDFLNHAKMLFLFAGTPPPPPPNDPAVHVFPAGVYHQSLNPKSGETYYLAPGSYFYGSLNLWKVENVKILGRGTVVYEGSQDPNNDEGWMQKPDWHCIGAMEARNVQINGLTCIVRARTWSIQMKDSVGFLYNDLRLIGGNTANANQDGMDWLGGGDTIVRDSFLRASDDIFAMQGNWDGYKDEDILRPGHDVQNVLIEHSVLSTSISNVVRAGWPRKTYHSHDFTLRDSDVLHAGIGACGQTFGLLGFWGADGAKGIHSDFTFENIFLDDWYSLAQLEQEKPALRSITFRNIWALDQPPLADSTMVGDVADVTFENVKYGQTRVTGNADLPLVVSAGTQQPHFVEPHGPIAAFTVDHKVFAPGEKVIFTAQPSPNARYTWFFGDGTQAKGRRVTHSFPDSLGTDLDGATGGDNSGRLGRFRVLLHVEKRTDKPDVFAGDWAAQGLVAVSHWHEPIPASNSPILPGLTWQVFQGSWTELPDLAALRAVFSGDAPMLRVDAQSLPHYAAAWDGLIDIPVDGGYTFHLLSRDGARLVIDGVQLAKTGPPFAQVCGAPGNAVRYDHGSLALRAGQHTLHIEGLHSASQGAPRLLWEGPGIGLNDVPPAAYSHLHLDAIKQ